MKKISDQDYDRVMQSLKHPALIFFYAPWSKACAPMKDILEDLMKTYQDRIGFFCMDIDENANMPASLGVTRIPAVFSLKQGVVAGKILGPQPRVQVREFIERLDNGSK